MANKNSIKFHYRLLVSFLIVSLFPLHFLIINLTEDVKAANQLTLTPVADTFVRKNVPNRNYGAWNDLSIGKSWNLGNYFSDAHTYIKFDISQLNPQTVIHSATLEMYQYVRSDNASGNYLVNVSKSDNSWSELGITWNNRPSSSGSYGQFWADGYSGQWFRPPKKYYADVTSLVREWANGAPNYGLVLSKQSGNVGGFWCSRNFNNATCFDSSVPRLIINYSQNYPPNIPNPASPINLAEIGGDSSGAGGRVTLRVNGLGDPNGDLDGTWFYYKRQQDTSWKVSPKRTGKKSAQFTADFNDGIWQWRARSRDSMGLWSNYSVIRTFTVDTTSPSQPIILNEPDFSPGDQNTVISSLSNDALIGEVRYKFRVYSGDHCDGFVSESNWQEVREFSINNLLHDEIYCYQVKSQDKLGNENNLSDFEKSKQDAVIPEITYVDLSEEVFSPNGDEIRDFIGFSFNIVEENFRSWNVFVRNASGTSVREFSDNLKSSNISWDGANNLGVIVEDGPYIFELHAYDLAGNEAVNDSQVAIVDNTPATLNISQPVNGSWFNTDKVTIAGITEPSAKLTLYYLGSEGEVVENQELTVDENGIFEVEVNIEIGENVFKLITVDLVGNVNSQELRINKENDIPAVSIIEPAGIINNQTFTIELGLKDHNLGTEQSGIDVSSVYLAIYDSGENEFVIVNEGSNIRHELGHIESNCESEITGGSIDCNYLFRFDSPFQPDGEYLIKAGVRDTAGNTSGLVEEDFSLDSHTFLDIEAPASGALVSSSKINIKGSAEIGSELTVSSGQQVVGLDIQPDNEIVTNCRVVDESFGPGWEGVKEVCDFSINDFQLSADFENDRYIENKVVFELTDPAGNLITEQVVVNVNLFAVNLSINSDLEYISPNGDGRQDGIDFTLEALNRDSKEKDVDIKEWEVRIRDGDSNIVSLLHGQDFLPINYYFDGKDIQGNWLSDGEYSYSLWIKTMDGIEFETIPRIFICKTLINGEVVITNPKDGTVTTRGVINIQGQAPLNSIVMICVDMIGIDGDCNDEQVVEVNNKGFFTAIIPLATLESYVWAQATDDAGNVTPKSNIIKVILDISDPLVAIYALPGLSGVNQEIVLRSVVTQHTEYISIRFLDYSNLNEIPEEGVNKYLIGKVDNNNDEDLDDPCDISQCVWDYSWITPEVRGGVYEIEFVGKKAETIKHMSLGIRIDGTIPVVPTILSIINSNSQTKLRQYQGQYYTNSRRNIITGVSEPLSYVHLLVDGQEIKSLKTDAIGLWKIELELPQSIDYKQYIISATSSDNVNNYSEVSLPVKVVLDKISPKFEKLETSNPYHKSGSVADILIGSDEVLFGGNLKRLDGVVFNLSQYEFTKEISGSFNLESNLFEGEYIAQVEIEDLAGNLSYEGIDYIIDNSPPDPTEIDSSSWGKNNGIYAKANIPAKGRLVPRYVVRGDHLQIYGKAEESAVVELWLSSVKVNESIVSSKNCLGSTKAYSDVYYKLCDWKYDLKLGGIERGYIVQVKVVDRAGNKSKVSEGKLIYRDKTLPIKPEVFSSNDYWNYDGLGNITNRIDVDLRGNAERLSDLEIWMTNPKGVRHYFFLKASQRGEWGKLVRLGSRIGTGEDGLYKINIKSTDAAGNRSEVLAFSIERDTFPPAPPNVGNPYICGFSICMKVSGEIGSKVIINGISYGRLLSNTRIFNVIHYMKFGINYKFEVQLEDRARNRSGKVNRDINTTLGAGDVEGVVPNDDPWSNRRGSDFGDIRFTTTIYPDGSYLIDGLHIPSPDLTHIYTDPEGIVSIWGVAVSDRSIIVTDIKKHYMTLNEAVKACNVGWFIDSGEKKCIEEKMGIGSYNSWVIDRKKECFFVNFFCFESRKKNWHNIKTYKDQHFPIQHAMISFHKDVDGDPYIGHLWNRDQDGRFENKFALNREVFVSDRIKASVKIFGEFEFDGVKIDYRGVNRKEAQKDRGLQSGFSNVMEVPEKVHIFEVAAHPLSDLSCSGYSWTSWYGWRLDPFTGERKFHSGVDLSKWGGCTIRSVYKGEASTGWYAGNTVFIKHDAIYETRYGHAKYYIGKYPRGVNSSEEIMYMGKSGKATGIHLHFEVWENGDHIDPTKYFTFENKVF